MSRSLAASLQHLNRTLRADEAAALPDADLVMVANAELAAFAEKLPVGTEFAFKWSPKKGAATVSDVKGEKIEPFASILEGDFAKK